jgi:hypothetical protein
MRFVLCGLTSLATFGLVPVPAAAQWPESQEIRIESRTDRVLVTVSDGQRQLPFAEYRFRGFAKPFVFPLYAPGGISITRHFPVLDDREDEARDHPHHKSMWFAHGDVNGFDFWSEKSQIRHRQIDEAAGNRLVTRNDWLDADGNPLCEDQTQMLFAAGDDWRTIDYKVTVTASHGELRFGDTKEGTFALRTHPALRLIDRDGQPAGEAFNSQGIRGAEVWGKPARWVHYRGLIDDQMYSITLMDDPQNLRHPTTWHAREYGLVAANPFGLSYFLKRESGSGDYTLKRGQRLRLRYGVLVHRGRFTVDQIEERFRHFAGLSERQ